MYCGKCGTKLSDYAAFCTKCGNPTGVAPAAAAASRPARRPIMPSPQPAGTTYAGQAPAAKHRVIGILAVLLAGLAVVMLCLALFAGRSYEKTIDKFFKAFNEGDGAAVVELMPPRKIAYLCDDENITKEEMAAEFTETLTEATQLISAFYGDWTLDYEILSTKEYTNDALENLKDDGDFYNVKIRDALDVKVEIQFYVDGRRISQDSCTFNMVKVGNNWYIWNSDVI